MMGLLASGLQGLKNAVLPPQCAVCGVALAEASHLCGGCWGQMSFIGAPLCPRLGIPLEADLGPGSMSARALMDPPVWDEARGVVLYETLARQLVHGFKYHDRMEFSGLMARLMQRAGRELLVRADVLIPVPLYRARLWRRRFNQAAELARLVAFAAGKPWEPEVLLRVRATSTQVGLKASERRANLRGAFQVVEGGQGRVRGKRVLLIDDVMTTGSTASEATLALLKAGASGVDVLVFALVVAPS
jgi:ComF family protein